jgi:hypothetical protein
MATQNRPWGAERIRGELLKLGIKVSKPTVQKYMRSVRKRRGGDQTWVTFVKNHADDIWCCDFVQTHDLLFRPLFLFFPLNQGSRKVVHIAATRNPTQDWTAQQLRNATHGRPGPKVSDSKPPREVRRHVRPRCQRRGHAGDQQTWRDKPIWGQKRRGFGARFWQEEFRSASFTVDRVSLLPLYSGYGFGLHRLRQWGERAGFSCITLSS